MLGGRDGLGGGGADPSCHAGGAINPDGAGLSVLAPKACLNTSV